MKLAYGTYAMPTVPVEEAIPLIAWLGYEGIEFCIGPEPFATTPEQVGVARRKKLCDLRQQHGLDVAALMIIRRKVLDEEEAIHRGNLDYLRRTAQLARDLGSGDTPVISMGIGGQTHLWEGHRDRIVQRLQDYARVAAQESFILAAEAHCGAAVDRTSRALWVINAVNDPQIRLHFDIVHFFLAGETIEDSVEALLPVTAHTHVSDARRSEGGAFEFRLPGEGELDMVTYVRAMHEGGWTGFITLEVSTRVWCKEGYDPYQAAVACYKTLDSAFREAGIPRT